MKKPKVLALNPLLKPCWALLWTFPLLPGSAALQPSDNGAPVFVSRSSASEGGVSASPASAVVSSTNAPSPLHTLQSRLVATSPSSSLPGIGGPLSRFWDTAVGRSWESSLELNLEDTLWGLGLVREAPQEAGVSFKEHEVLGLSMSSE